MKQFLKETAESIINQYSDNLNKLCFVFPNKRTKMFFRKHYAEIIGKTDFAPDMKDLRQLVKNFTKLTEPDKLTLIFNLYDVFKKIDTKNTALSDYSLDDFFKTGEIIINDFNEIDNWLVNPELIFKNIKETKEIEAYFNFLTQEQKNVLKNFWGNFSEERKSEEKRKFIELWNLLPILYNNFKDLLLSKNTAYNGLMYRRLCELIDEEKINSEKYLKYVFIGFNALTNAEIKLFQYFNKLGKAHFFWDTDTYYHNDLIQEAGDFLRKNFDILNQSSFPIPSNFINSKKNIEFIGIPLHVGQAKILPEILENFNTKNNINDTAIVLSDEHNLFPVLHSIPDYITNINVTMGYPFKMTSLFDLIKKYCKLRADSYKKNDGIYYYKDVISILRHPEIMQYNTQEALRIIDYIEMNNIINVDAHILLKSKNPLFDEIFKLLPKENPTEALLSNILNLLFLLFDKQNKNIEEHDTSKSIEMEYLHKSYVLIKQFREIVRNRENLLSLNLIIDLLIKNLSSQQIPFAGKAEEGLQLMGVLESRNLDFKNLIILGVNEGNLPSVSSSATFLSQSIRYVFDLPLIKHQDSVYAYLFYRMLQRAENITIIYNSIVNDSYSGEKSRFLLQLLQETEFNISEKQFKEEILTTEKEEISIHSNSETKKILESYLYSNGAFRKEFSPSALNTFINCKLKFYFRYIAKLKPKSEIEEEISPAAIGTIIHSSLEHLYKNLFLKKNSRVIELDDFKYLSGKINNAIDNSFNKHYKIPEDREFQYENNMIVIKEVIKKYIKLVLKHDKTYAPFEIVSLEGEKKYHTEITIEVNGNKEQVRISGVIDRVDKKGDLYRIIDYKTGSVQNKIKNIHQLFNSEEKNRKSHVFQAMLYSYIYSEMSKPMNIKIIPSLFYLREMNNSFSSHYINFNGNELNETLFAEILPEYKQNLNETISMIFSYNNIFNQTLDTENCRYCEYNLICNK